MLKCHFSQYHSMGTVWGNCKSLSFLDSGLTLNPFYYTFSIGGGGKSPHFSEPLCPHLHDDGPSFTFLAVKATAPCLTSLYSPFSPHYQILSPCHRSDTVLGNGGRQEPPLPSRASHFVVSSQ